MNKIPKEKRDRIILISIGAVALMAAIWYLVISGQNEALDKYDESIAAAEAKIAKAQSGMRGAGLVQAELVQLRERLELFENRMIPVEQLSGKKWLYDTIFNFVKRKGYDVVPTSISNEPHPGREFLMLPNFYYMGAYWTVSVRAYYHEFGKFLSDFENSFPLICIQDITASPVSGTVTTGGSSAGGAGGAAAESAETVLSMADREKLAIKMRIVVLSKPVGSL